MRFSAKRGELMTSTAAKAAQLIVYPIICRNVLMVNEIEVNKLMSVHGLINFV